MCKGDREGERGEEERQWVREGGVRRAREGGVGEG